MRLNPDPFTLAELHAMALAHERSEWDRTASIIQKLHNVNCTNRANMIADARTLNPYRERPKRERISSKEHRRMMEMKG